MSSDNVKSAKLSGIKNPTILIVEPNPYHGIILPGYAYMFQQLGYDVYVFMREEVYRDNPFASYPKKSQPKIFFGSIEEIKEILLSNEVKNFELIFYSTNVYWTVDNHSSFIEFLGAVPSGRYGSLFVEHNLTSIKEDDAELLLKTKRVFTLLEYKYQNKTTPMLNPSYFGEFNAPANRNSPPKILVIGSSSYIKENLQRFYKTIRKLKKENLDFKISMLGKDTTPPADLTDSIDVLGHREFKELFQLILEHDFLFTIIDPNSKNFEQSKYLQGTTSGTVLLSLGLATPMIIDAKHALLYGFNKTSSVIYEQNIEEGLREAIQISPKRLESLRVSLKKIYEDTKSTSLKNLEKSIELLKNNITENSLNDTLLLHTITVRKLAKLLDIKKATHELPNRIIDNIKAIIEEKNILFKQIEILNQQLSTTEAELAEQENIISYFKVKESRNRYKITDKIISMFESIVGGTNKDSKALKMIKKVYGNANSKIEKRNLKKSVALLKKSNLFNQDYYLSNNPDVAHTPIEPTEHYLRYGYKENRTPSLGFDQTYYLAKYADVRALGVPALLHYVKYGQDEGRKPRLGYEIDIADKRTGLVFQLDAFDKGGLEEVVLMLASNKSISRNYRVYIFVTGDCGYLAEMAKKLGIAVIGLGKNPEFLDYLVKTLNIKITNLHYSLFGINKYKQNNVRLIYTIHNNYVWLDNNIAMQRREEYRKIDSFIAVSDQVAQYFSSRFHISPEKIQTVTNGISLEKLRDFSPVKRSEFGLEKNDFVFINVASFSPYKFHADMIVGLSRIVKENPKAKLLLVGNVIDQTYFALIKSLITKYGVEKNVQIIDYVPKEKLLGLLRISDCFLMPSLTEGFSIAMLEAMYSELPMILTDVGGARHAIDNNDIGIVIPNAYGEPIKLTSDLITEKYTNDSHLNNLDDLVKAMLDMVINDKVWKKKAKLGRSKVEKQFLSENVVSGYLEHFRETLYANDHDLISELDTILGRSMERVFFAPYPTKDRVTEGWMSRINVIDKLIGDRKKLYVNVNQNNTKPFIEQHDNNGWELTIGKDSHLYPLLLDKIFEKAITVYIHTLHLAEYALPWIDSGKVIVDIHGITPEEEVMLGRAYLKEKYERIEKVVLERAKACVMVTGAMSDHYRRKYPKIKPRKIIILPIVESIPVNDKRNANFKNNKIEVVYSGGSQAWQNIDAMLQLATLRRDNLNITFLSHDWENIKRRGIELGVPSSVKYEFCDKSKLYEKYKEFDLGLVLRDDTPVNKVACPTKLYEYMACGVLPVVRVEHMGDFMSLGYQYITEADLLKGRIPDANMISDMLKKNYIAVKKLGDLFREGSHKLTSLISN